MILELILTFAFANLLTKQLYPFAFLYKFIQVVLNFRDFKYKSCLTCVRFIHVRWRSAAAISSREKSINNHNMELNIVIQCVKEVHKYNNCVEGFRTYYE